VVPASTPLELVDRGVLTFGWLALIREGTWWLYERPSFSKVFLPSEVDEIALKLTEFTSIGGIADRGLARTG
jgi:hypothetical protein